MTTVLFVVCSIVNTGARIYDVGDRVSQGEGICKNEIYRTMKPGRAEFVHRIILSLYIMSLPCIVVR